MFHREERDRDRQMTDSALQTAVTTMLHVTAYMYYATLKTDTVIICSAPACELHDQSESLLLAFPFHESEVRDCRWLDVALSLIE